MTFCVISFLVIENVFTMKALISYFKGHMIKQIIHDEIYLMLNFEILNRPE